VASSRVLEFANLPADAAIAEKLRIGIGDPVTQFPVPTSRGTAWCDLRIGRHIVEFDGRGKYVAAERGGFADRSVEEVLWAEKVREREVTAHGLGMSRVFWDDCLGRARAATMRRLAEEHAATVRRFGTQLPDHLTAYAVDMAAERLRRIRAVSPYAA
jgi:hypothetical protein